tara:strand:+ start:158 stop:1612 length:1455 start_codon:yes stop_codon:yes gene_type:complete
LNFSSQIFSAIFKSGLGTIGKVFFNAIAIKIIALLMGPSGVGIFSQLRQLWQTSVTIGSLNSGVAIVQGASSKEDSEKSFFINSIFWTVTLVNSLTSVLLVYYSKEVSVFFLNSSSNESIEAIKWLALASFFGVYLIFFSSVLTIYYAIGRYSIVAATSGFVLLIFAWPAANKSGVFVVELVWMIIISEFIALLLCIVFLVKDRLLPSLKVRLKFNFIFEFFKTSYVLLVTGIFAMTSLLFIRGMIIDKYGFYGAGIFDASWMLCMVYVLILTKSFGTYFLPKLSSMNDANERNILVVEGLRIVILISVPVIVFMISFKPLILNLLYTNEFIESLTIMKWMLLGDFFKILSWLLAFLIIANKDMKVFLLLELISTSFLLFGVHISIKYFGTFESIGIIFMLIYIPYFIFTLIYNQLMHGLKLNKSIITFGSFGLLVIIASAINTWHALSVNYLVSSLNVIMSIIFTWLVLKQNERSWLLNKFNL